MKKPAALRLTARILILITACALIAAGASQNGFKDVNNKAARICYECIGIG